MEFTIDNKKINGQVEIANWVKDGLKPDAINYALEFGKYLAQKNKGLTTSQIRNVYGEVVRMRMKKFSEIEQSFLMLKPKLAYAAERKGTEGSRAFKKVMEVGITTVLLGENNETKQNRFDTFANFFEAVLAYHKAEGGQ